MDNCQPQWDSMSLPYDDVRRIWLRFSHPNPDYSDTAYPPFVFEPTYIEINPEYHATIGSDTLPKLANKLSDCASNPQNHIQMLNHEMAANIICTFDRTLPQTVDKAFDLLSRLPRYPLDIPIAQIVGSKHMFISRPISDEYLAPDQSGEEVMSNIRLKVVSLVDGCTMRIALAIAERPTYSLCSAIKSFLGIIAKLMDMLLEREIENECQCLQKKDQRSIRNE
jgi:hypothetical protein